VGTKLTPCVNFRAVLIKTKKSGLADERGREAEGEVARKIKRDDLRYHPSAEKKMIMGGRSILYRRCMGEERKGVAFKASGPVQRDSVKLR